MKDDQRLNAHLAHCEEVAKQKQKDCTWHWDAPEPETVLSQETVDAVAELVTVLQSIRRNAAERAKLENETTQKHELDNEEADSGAEGH